MYVYKYTLVFMHLHFVLILAKFLWLSYAPPGSGAAFPSAGNELVATTADGLPRDRNVQHRGGWAWGLGVSCWVDW